MQQFPGQGICELGSQIQNFYTGWSYMQVFVNLVQHSLGIYAKCSTIHLLLHVGANILIRVKSGWNIHTMMSLGTNIHCVIGTYPITR